MDICSYNSITLVSDESQTHVNSQQVKGLAVISPVTIVVFNRIIQVGKDL